MQIPPIAESFDGNSVGDLRDQFVDDGVLWIRDVFPVELIERLRNAFERRYLARDRFKLQKRFPLVGDRRYMITVKIKRPFDLPILFANPWMVPLLQELLGSNYLISSFGAVVALGGADAQRVHCDFPPLFESESLCTTLPPHAVTMLVPLVDLDEKTGATAVWPGSHRQVGARAQLERLAEQETFEGSVLPLPQAGDALLMDYRLIHAGTPNRGDHDRPILYFVYSRPWFCEDQNFTEQVPIRMSEKTWRQLSGEHRTLFQRRAAAKAALRSRGK